MKKTITKKRGRLDGRDLLNGLITAIITPALVLIQQSLDKGEFVFNWKIIAMASVGGGAAYLLRKLVENTKTITIEKSK